MMPADDLQYGLEITGLDPASLGDAVRAVIADAMMDPLRLGTWMTQLALAEQSVGMNFLRRLSGEAVQATLTGDRRFADAAWKGNPFLVGLVEDYTERSKAALGLIDGSRLPEATRKKAKFAMQLLVDAMAPSNVPWLNPAVVKEAMDTGGHSLVRGLQNYLRDIEENGGMPQQVDASGFELGKNIAVTPGRVVFRNELIELIAYEPQTPEVHAIPLLMSPPWINKYYVMDLAPKRSFVEWAVRQGHQTFMISYRNPDSSMKEFGMDEYLRLGPLAALDAVERITGSPTTNIAALCLGGTLSLLLLAYLAAHGEGSRVNSLTVTNTLIDFGEPGDLAVFTDETTISRLEQRMFERGYLEAKEMSGTFDWMRSNDLIWNYVVNNWYLGKQPPAFDILAWNGDSTRMPARMHSEYLRACYLHNLIVKPGAFRILDTPVDLGAIETPLYVLGAESDHIAPWRSTYKTVQFVGGSDVTFTLTNAGHIAGIINPPDNPKTAHWTKPQIVRGESADDWRATAEKHPSSWWEDWARWIGARAGEMTPPAPLPAGDPAPGSYVRNESGAPHHDPAGSRIAAPAPVDVEAAPAAEAADAWGTADAPEPDPPSITAPKPPRRRRL